MIERVFILAFMVWAIYKTYQKDEVFGFVSTWGKKHIHKKLQKPIFSCPICMMPWYGTPIYLLGNRLGIELFSDVRWFMIAFTVVAGIGLNSILNELFPKEEIIIKAPVEPES